jgi:hypothetical protein
MFAILRRRLPVSRTLPLRTPELDLLIAALRNDRLLHGRLFTCMNPWEDAGEVEAQ